MQFVATITVPTAMCLELSCSVGVCNRIEGVIDPVCDDERQWLLLFLPAARFSLNGDSSVVVTYMFFWEEEVFEVGVRTWCEFGGNRSEQGMGGLLVSNCYCRRLILKDSHRPSI